MHCGKRAVTRACPPQSWVIRSGRVRPPSPFRQGRAAGCGCAVLVSGPASLVAVLEPVGTGVRDRRARYPRFLRQVESKVGEPLRNLDLTSLTTGLTTPALIVHDRNDKEIPVEDAIALAAAWPGAKPFITERYGHRRIMFATEVVAEIVAFIARGRAT